jgi:hypothetical protein
MASVYLAEVVFDALTMWEQPYGHSYNHSSFQSEI